jgi:hypothetical protein
MKTFVSLLACAFLLMGCATPLAKVDKLETALEGVKSITLVTPREPWSYSVMNLVGSGFFSKNLNIQITVNESKNRQVLLTDMLKREGFSFSFELTTQIADALSKSGYQVTIQDGPWENEYQIYKLKYTDIQSNTDAVLVIAPVVVGFVSPSGTQAYSPTVTTTVTLLNKDKTRALYQGYLASGWKPPNVDWSFVEPRQTFPTFDVVLANPSKTVESLKNACTAIADLLIKGSKT